MDPADPPAWIIIAIIFVAVLAFAAFLRINAAIRAWGRRRDEPLPVLLLHGLLILIDRSGRWAYRALRQALDGGIFTRAELETDRPSPVRRGSPVRARRLRVVTKGGNGAKPSAPAVISTVTASGRDVTPVTPVTEVTVSVTETALIATLLARGMSPSSVAKRLPGYSPKNYDECKAKVALVRRELESEVVARRLEAAGVREAEPV